ncbi:MAG: serine/threonine protein kinase [Polyangiaceae bacterium]|nr:serine/threonine protein kinase [Polyangiaceae bacterium]
MSKKHEFIYREGDVISAAGWVFVVLAVLGHGGMSETYKVQDLTAGSIFVVKLLHRSLLHKREFLEREARVLGRLDHPYIVKVFQLNYTYPEGLPLIVMEYLDGIDLSKVLESVGRLELYDSLNIGSQVFLGANHGHVANLVHCDLKPSNIHLLRNVPGRQATVKLLDYGISKVQAEAKSKIFAGTPGYVSPEQALGEEIGPPSDVFSAGVVFFEMTTGRRPFHEYGTSFEAMIKTARLRAPSLGTFGKYPKRVVRLADAFLELDPRNRPSAGEGGAELRVELRMMSPPEEPLITEEVMATFAAKQAPITMGALKNSMIVVPAALVRSDENRDTIRDPLPREALPLSELPAPNPALPLTIPDAAQARTAVGSPADAPEGTLVSRGTPAEILPERALPNREDERPAVNEIAVNEPASPEPSHLRFRDMPTRTIPPAPEGAHEAYGRNGTLKIDDASPSPAQPQVLPRRTGTMRMQAVPPPPDPSPDPSPPSHSRPIRAPLDMPVGDSQVCTVPPELMPSQATEVSQVRARPPEAPAPQPKPSRTRRVLLAIVDWFARYYRVIVPIEAVVFVAFGWYFYREMDSRGSKAPAPAASASSPAPPASSVAMPLPAPVALPPASAAALPEPPPSPAAPSALPVASSVAPAASSVATVASSVAPAASSVAPAASSVAAPQPSASTPPPVRPVVRPPPPRPRRPPPPPPPPQRDDILHYM